MHLVLNMFIFTRTLVTYARTIFMLCVQREYRAPIQLSPRTSMLLQLFQGSMHVDKAIPNDVQATGLR